MCYFLGGNISEESVIAKHEKITHAQHVQILQYSDSAFSKTSTKLNSTL